MAGVALCAIDGLLVWRVLGLVTSTLRFCGFPKAGLPSCSAPFSRGSASVLPSPSGAPFCPLSCASPSKRTFLARLLFICLAVLLVLSGCPFWPLSGPNPSKRTSQLSQSWFAWRCSLLFLVAPLGKRAAEILQSGLAQLFFCFVSSFLLWLCFCAPFSLWYSVLSAERPSQILQNGPPGREQGAHPSRPSWRGPFWRIWAAKWTKRSTRERKGQRPMRLEEQGRSVLTDLGC